jgi:hypothetical protein
MAEVINSFPPTKTQSRYPWDQWLDGQIWQLAAGEDFTSKPETFRQNAAGQAQRRGGAVRSRLLEDGDRQVVVVQFQPRPNG